MSGIAGWVGPNFDDNVGLASMQKMLGAIEYRGDSSDLVVGDGYALGLRFWKGRAHRESGVYRSSEAVAVCAGTMVSPLTHPAQELVSRTVPEVSGTETLDGEFAGAIWDVASRRMTLIRDPFGAKSLYWYRGASGRIYFASELKQLLALAEVPRELDYGVIHKYLTFSFVPGKEMPIRGVERLLAGRVATIENGVITARPYLRFVEEVDPALQEQPEAVRTFRRIAKQAVKRRLTGEREVGVFLSGGLDSSAVAFWLRHHGQSVRAFTADFGDKSVEREEAESVARTLEIPLTKVQVSGREFTLDRLLQLAHRLDLPFGDPVTGPQWLLAEAARSAGLSVVFNGEGGDQLFGGWTNKPMIAHALFSGLYEDDAGSDEEAYLRSYHRFYGLEEELYSDTFAARVGPKGQRRALLAPLLGDPNIKNFLNRIRMADIVLKGEQNILPRAERISSAHGLDMRTPLFDRSLAELSFRLPTDLKLHGACEKYVFKLSLQDRLPDSIVWRRKFGMSVPATDWTNGPLRAVVAEVLGPEAIARRGLFRGELVQRLRDGRSEAGETRRRRVGEKLWCLLMLELWLRAIFDGSTVRP